MNKLNVGQRLAILVGIPITIIVLLVIFSLSSFFNINQGIGRIYDDRVVPLTQLKNITDGYTMIINAINKADNGLKNPDEALKELHSGEQEVRDNWGKYIKGHLNTEEKDVSGNMDVLFNNANTIISEAAGVLQSMGDTLQYDEDGYTLITDYNGDLFEYIDPIAEKITTLITLQLKIAKQERVEAQNIYDRSFRWYIAIGIVALVVLVTTGIWMGRTIVVPLNELRNMIKNADSNKDLTVHISIDRDDEIGSVARAFSRMIERFRVVITDVGLTSEQLQTYANTLSQATVLTREGVAVQTVETDHVASSSSQMTQAMEDVSRHAAQAAEAATSANSDTNDGARVLKEAIESINTLATRINSASEVINRVETDSNAIGTVLDVIRGIADQTNLLALNAAIEAARAGEQGRGFAVVADEVRSLAQRTQQSTQEIQEMIERLQSGAIEAVKSMADGTENMQTTVTQAEVAGSSLNAIANAVAIINDMNQQIADATEQQMSVSREISLNVGKISDVAKGSEHSVENVENASRDLKDAANRLSNLVGEFRVSN
jgi:methyl-accepting chemotaxis protein